ncbi:hypothetical protein Pst134EA_009255 [Puccinia striiformis f. sp. tritici]|nr:hypothetical protein Pst134EA_009255 [Puccinia striiformis f. sp. tritici]KAH9468724.1 hypothetical protein Pst134EA_009255 [Puccinia striiformis f. sp. tritici]
MEEQIQFSSIWDGRIGLPQVNTGWAQQHELLVTCLQSIPLSLPVQPLQGVRGLESRSGQLQLLIHPFCLFFCLVGVSRPSSVTSHLRLAENPLPPLDPMPKDNNEPDHGPRTSEADAYSAYCSLDGFIQPPPPHVATAYQAIGPEDFQPMYLTNCPAE